MTIVLTGPIRMCPPRVVKMLCGQIDEAADLCGEVLTMRIDRIDRPLDRGELGQDRKKPAGLEFVGDQKCRHIDQALTKQGGLSQRIDIIRLQVAGYWNRLVGVRAREIPL